MTDTLICLRCGDPKPTAEFPPVPAHRHRAPACQECATGKKEGGMTISKLTPEVRRELSKLLMEAYEKGLYERTVRTDHRLFSRVRRRPVLLRDEELAELHRLAERMDDQYPKRASVSVDIHDLLSMVAELRLRREVKPSDGQGDG